jgi:hypothetical protein
MPDDRVGTEWLLASRPIRCAAEPERGCLWIHDINDQQTVAFTSDGMDYLREMIPQ